MPKNGMPYGTPSFTAKCVVVYGDGLLAFITVFWAVSIKQTSYSGEEGASGPSLAPNFPASEFRAGRSPRPRERPPYIPANCSRGQLCGYCGRKGNGPAYRMACSRARCPQPVVAMGCNCFGHLLALVSMGDWASHVLRFACTGLACTPNSNHRNRAFLGPTWPHLAPKTSPLLHLDIAFQCYPFSRSCETFWRPLLPRTFTLWHSQFGFGQGFCERYVESINCNRLDLAA